MDLNGLIKISKAKKEYLNEMLLLTEEQGKIIELEDIDQLNRLIEEKQNRINEINSLDEQFQDSFSKIKTQLGVKDIGELLESRGEELRDLKEETAEILSIVKDIKILEKQNSLMLERQKKEVSKKLKEVKNNKAALNKYAKSKPIAAPNPAFFDQKK